MSREPLKPMVILGRKIMAIEGRVGEGVRQEPPKQKAVFIHTEAFSAQPGLVQGVGISRHHCLAASRSWGLTSDTATGLAI